MEQFLPYLLALIALAALWFGLQRYLSA
jgi:hypothetical protein